MSAVLVNHPNATSIAGSLLKRKSETQLDKMLDSDKPPQRKSQRIPKALQDVFIASNIGNEVDTPPPEGVASKVYLRNWINQPTSHSSSERRSSFMSNNLFGDSSEKIQRFYENIPDTSFVPLTNEDGTEERHLSFLERAKVSPQILLDEHMKSRGYSTQTYKSLNTAYYSVPSALQRASYGSYLIGLVKRGDAQGLQEALRAGLSPNPCNQFGETLLHMVCRRGDMKLLQIMLDHGASVQVVDDYGRTPLHDACWAPRPCFDVVKALLQLDNRLFYMLDCRGSLPLSYVHRDHFAAWEELLDTEFMDNFYPLDHATADAPELCKLWPNARPLLDQKNALMPEVAKMIADGKMSVQEVVALFIDDLTDDDFTTESGVDSEYSDSNEEDTCGENNYDSLEEEE